MDNKVYYSGAGEQVDLESLSPEDQKRLKLAVQLYYDKGQLAMAGKQITLWINTKGTLEERIKVTKEKLKELGDD
jgi:hypothetical protein